MPEGANFTRYYELSFWYPATPPYILFLFYNFFGYTAGQENGSS